MYSPIQRLSVQIEACRGNCTLHTECRQRPVLALRIFRCAEWWLPTKPPSLDKAEKHCTRRDIENPGKLAGKARWRSVRQMPEVERRHNRVLHLKVGRVSHGVRHQTVVSALRPVTARNPKPNPFVLGLNGRGKKLELVRVEKSSYYHLLSRIKHHHHHHHF